MINIVVVVNKQKQVTYYVSKGHAQKNQVGSKDYLAVCNSISILEYQFLYGIKEIFKNQILSSEIKSGFFKLEMKPFDLKNQELISNFKLISKYFLIGVNLLVKNYPNYIQLQIKEK